MNQNLEHEIRRAKAELEIKREIYASLVDNIEIPLIEGDGKIFQFFLSLLSYPNNAVLFYFHKHPDASNDEAEDYAIAIAEKLGFALIEKPNEIWGLCWESYKPIKLKNGYMARFSFQVAYKVPADKYIEQIGTVSYKSYACKAG